MRTPGRARILARCCARRSSTHFKMLIVYCWQALVASIGFGVDAYHGIKRFRDEITPRPAVPFPH
ncbi:hypothetical protein [Dactylosporangium sp. CS-033363]|uniref:hypothetical protein n=1 Tax=Dactylosporangium sp. CS-033363 TaxID=3239935 RepID=UPI003D8C9B73